MKRAIDRAMTDFIYMVKRIEGMDQVDLTMVAHCFTLALAKHLDPLCLSTDEIDQVCDELRAEST